MSHRFRALEELEVELARVVARAQGDTERPGLVRRFTRARRNSRLWLLIPGIAVLLVTTTIALAATGVILNGAPVAPSGQLSPVVGAGLPLPGQSRLLGLRIPDPSGGLPWGMRVVHTTRGLVCVQIGRVQNGQLGELGIDGAYHDDGRFHPVGAGVLPTYAGGASEGGVTSERGSCVLADGDVTGNGEAWGSAVAGEFGGVDENAAFAPVGHPGLEVHPAPQAHPGPVTHRRDITYGILGPHAVSVTYREGGALRTQQVVAGVGAYLIVQLASSNSVPEGHGESPGTDTPGEGPGTTGVLTTVTYTHDGKICENGYNARTGGKVKIQHPCPPPKPYPADLRVTPPGSFVRRPTVVLKVSHNAVTAAELSFSAPFAVTSAAEGYSLWSKPCRGGREGGGVAVLDRNVAQGATVHLTLEDPFSARCAGRSISVEVLYDSSGPDAKRSYGRAPGELVIATVTVRLPRGEHPVRLPRYFRRFGPLR
jgi:hypothetical protein